MKKIILIVGASGAGKDTLLKSIKNNIEANFVTRYVTRMPDKNESNYYISKEDFLYLQKNDFFVSSWEAHSNIYGISHRSIKDGINIISISRSTIKDFEKEFNDVTSIEIAIPKDMLYNRLINRGREDREAILKRIQRSEQKIEAKNLIYFDNSKPLEQSRKDFLSLLNSLVSMQ